MNGTGWLYLPFDSVFVRNPNQNLIIAVDNNTRAPTAILSLLKVTATADNRTIAYRVDGSTPVNPPTPPTASALYAFVPSISFQRHMRLRRHLRRPCLSARTRRRTPFRCAGLPAPPRPRGMSPTVSRTNTVWTPLLNGHPAHCHHPVGLG